MSEELMPYFLTTPDNSIKKGVITAGATLEDILKKEGIQQNRKDLSISMDNVIVNAETLVNAVSETGMVNLSIALKIENG